MNPRQVVFTVTAALPLLVAAQGVAYVSSEKDHALAVLDLKTQAVIGIVPTCKRPRHL